ncbi:hypothetical protein MNEG_3169 [Monoraphidium neglectum]|uniref:Phosphatidic acid phosphatase type 2/haloperoxidase domain-containing protein n=1 Tax=Monoraphidium neglectum TaxID=145388 RepID=A0A0D2LDK7_9CHLO|nr:hypothetical protein MNEG_3169 [Monoraphidium neglectum]KIZ04789.1 hypothetical protein MNEG_3169 [Monoraphidium neglectum]|eukprot:XP_013903808.1 hypothetical protein MNEG_3169 [Monoraphidium neglectum]
MARSLVLALALVVALSYVPQSHALLNNTITQWVNATREVARVQGLPNTLAIQEYAFVSVAIYRALEAGGAPEDLLAAYAAHTTLSTRFPVLQPKFDALLKAQVAGRSQADLDKARAVAAPIAQVLIIERVDDPAVKYLPYKSKPAGTPYAYQLQPGQTFVLAPQLGDSIPFVWPKDKLRAFTENKDPAKGKVFSPPKEPAELATVVDLGARVSKGRTKFDNDTAFFWALGAGLGGGSSSVSGLWLEIAQRVLPVTLSLKETALIHAKITTAFYDGYIACWQVKYRTDFWRPTTAVRQGWPGFAGIKDWQPNLANPNFPEYPSGHQCASGSALAVLQRFLGKDAAKFTIISDGAPDIGPRSYTSLQAAANEAADSRLFAGLHFNRSNYDGQDLGRLVAEYVYDNFEKSPAVVGKAQAACASPTLLGSKVAAAAAGNASASDDAPAAEADAKASDKEAAADGAAADTAKAPAAGGAAADTAKAPAASGAAASKASGKDAAAGGAADAAKPTAAAKATAGGRRLLASY